MQKDLDRARAVPVQVLLHVDDRVVSVLPDVLVLAELMRQAFILEHLRMHAHHQHLFIVRAVEDADAPALRQPNIRAPQEVVLELGGAGLLEAFHVASLRIDARHDVPNRAILAGRVHALKDDQQRVAIGAVEQLLLIAQRGDVLLEQGAIFLLRLVEGFDLGGRLIELDLCVWAYTKLLGIDRHSLPVFVLRRAAWCRTTRSTVGCRQSRLAIPRLHPKVMLTVPGHRNRMDRSSSYNRIRRSQEENSPCRDQDFQGSRS